MPLCLLVVTCVTITYVTDPAYPRIILEEMRMHGPRQNSSWAVVQGWQHIILHIPLLTEQYITIRYTVSLGRFCPTEVSCQIHQGQLPARGTSQGAQQVCQQGPKRILTIDLLRRLLIRREREAKLIAQWLRPVFRLSAHGLLRN